MNGVGAWQVTIILRNVCSFTYCLQAPDAIAAARIATDFLRGQEVEGEFRVTKLIVREKPYVHILPTELERKS